MQVVIVALAAVVLGVGILSSNHTQTSDDTLTATEAPLVEVAVLGIDSSPAPTETPEPTTTPTVVPTSTPTPQVSSITLSAYVYPGSTVVASSNERLELTTVVDPNTVTDWYRNLIKEDGFSVTSSIKTSTNDIINNKLVAAKSNQRVDVSVTNKNGSTSIIIVVGE